MGTFIQHDLSLAQPVATQGPGARNHIALLEGAGPNAVELHQFAGQIFIRAVPVAC